MKPTLALPKGAKNSAQTKQTVTTSEVKTVTAAELTKPNGQAKEVEKYVLGKKYVPKTERNSETWGKICAAVKDGPKTLKELAEVCEGHKDFVGYMTRGGHLVLDQKAAK